MSAYRYTHTYVITFQSNDDREYTPGHLSAQLRAPIANSEMNIKTSSIHENFPFEIGSTINRPGGHYPVVVLGYSAPWYWVSDGGRPRSLHSAQLHGSWFTIRPEPEDDEIDVDYDDDEDE